MLSIMENRKLLHSFNTDEYSLIRTGTIGDGSCFFHSILTALSATYRNSSNGIKKSYIKKFRKKIADTFDMNDWHSFSGMEMLVQNMIHKHIKNTFTNQLDTDSIGMSIRCICSFDRLDRDILPRAFDLLSKKYKQNVTENNYIEDLTNYIVNYITIFTSTTIPEEDTEENRDKETLTYPFVSKRWGACIENRDEVLTQFKTRLNRVLKASEKDIFEKFKESVTKVGSWVDNDILVKHVSDMFNINIMILDGQTNKPYTIAIRREDTRPYIMLYYIPGIHFEGMGVYNHNTKYIQRKFTNDSDIVKWFKMN